MTPLLVALSVSLTSAVALEANPASTPAVNGSADDCPSPLYLHALRLTDDARDSPMTMLMQEVASDLGEKSGLTYEVHSWPYPRTLAAIRSGEAHAVVMGSRMANVADPKAGQLPLMRMELVVLRKVAPAPVEGEARGPQRLGIMRGATVPPSLINNGRYAPIEVHDSNAGYRMLLSDRLDGFLVMTPEASVLGRIDQRPDHTKVVEEHVGWQSLVIQWSSRLPAACQKRLETVAREFGPPAVQASFSRQFPGLDFSRYALNATAETR